MHIPPFVREDQDTQALKLVLRVFHSESISVSSWHEQLSGDVLEKSWVLVEEENRGAGSAAEAGVRHYFQSESTQLLSGITEINQADSSTVKVNFDREEPRTRSVHVAIIQTKY